ncbi:MAG TPA: hypothetical protein VGU66_12665 [Candidatus Elarobacter sp.]|nr:hypothetical protein [Candidatus Elarobacter sp.]
MRSFRTFFSALAVVALAACGGGSGGSTLPAANDPGTLTPSGNSVAFQKGSIWVGYHSQVNAFPADGNGAVTPTRKPGPFPWPHSISQPGVVDIAIAPGGTEWLLENRDFALGGPGWQLFAVAPGDTTPENSFIDQGDSPFALGLGGDGIMVGYHSTTSNLTTIATYPYAASNAPPVRTFQTTSAVLGFAEGNDGLLYVMSPTNQVNVYLPTSTGCCPVRTINLTGLTGHVTISSQEFTVGPNNSIYVTDLPGNNANPVMYVNVYPPGSGKVGRRIGPIPADYGGSGFPVIAVDAANRLFVATTGKIYRFGPTANGTDAPQRVITDPTADRPVAMSAGPTL